MSYVVTYNVFDARKADEGWRRFFTDGSTLQSKDREETPLTDLLDMIADLGKGETASKAEVLPLIMLSDLWFGNIASAQPEDGARSDGAMMSFLFSVLLPSHDSEYGVQVTTDLLISLYEAIPQANLLEEMKKLQLSKDRQIRVHNYLFDLRPVAKLLKEDREHLHLVVAFDHEFEDEVIKQRAETILERFKEKYPGLAEKLVD